MNEKWNILFLIALVSLAGLAHGQSSENAVLRTPPAGTSWTLRIERVTAAGDKEPLASESTGEPTSKPSEPVATGLLMKTGRNGVSLGQITFSDGKQETFYVAQGLLISKSSNTDRISAVAPGNSDLYSMKVAGFPGTAWITSLYEKGKQTRGEQDCFYFLYDVPVGDPERPAMKMEAWVQKDGYPLEIVIHGEVIYHFGKVVPFDQDIPLPEAYRAVIAKRGKQRAALDLIRKANKMQ